MRYIRTLLPILLLFSAINLFGQDALPLQEGTVVVLPTLEKGKELIGVEDDYTAILSKFDLMSKTLRTDHPTVKDYLDFAQNTVMDWSPDDRLYFASAVKSISELIRSQSLKISMPDTIFIVKSNMKNEGGAEGYTRGKTVFLKGDLVKGKGESLQGVIIHEMWHVISRNDAAQREKVYNTLGFKNCNRIEYPEGFKDMIISNPDAPHNEFYITVNYNGKPVDAVLVIYSKTPYAGGSFFFYLKLGLMLVEGDDSNKKAVIKDGNPVIVEEKDVKNFYEQVGKNTAYIIHEEEISADQFVMVLNQTKGIPNPELIDAFRKVLSAN